MLPLVSIVIPVYNGADYLKEAIDSALSQTYENIEIIVVNDGSTDHGETERIALSYGDKLRYIKKENGGVSSALNEGIRNMCGEYFSWLSHDDMYAPKKIESEIEALRLLDKTKTIAICNYDKIDKASNKIEGEIKAFPSGVYEWAEATVYVTNHGAHGCSLLIPKSAFDKVGLFDENLRYCQDIYMWWQLTLGGYGLAFCSYVGVHSRIHAKQLTQTGSKLYHHDAGYIGERLVSRFEGISGREHNFLYEYAKNEAIHGNRDTVSKCRKSAENRKLFGAKEKVLLDVLTVYGLVRPIIRKAYYKLFRNINTK